jgi:hypothetical protein
MSVHAISIGEQAYAAVVAAVKMIAVLRTVGAMQNENRAGGPWAHCNRAGGPVQPAGR